MSKLASLQSKLQEITEKIENQLKKSSSRNQLYEGKTLALGKQGELTLLMREMGSLDPGERPLLGQALNHAKARIEEIYAQLEQEFLAKETRARIEAESLDMSLPGASRGLGSMHPIWKVTEGFYEILHHLGYSVKLGTHIEKDHYNFEALNIPKDHPARDMQDTFFIDSDTVLRTHTSPVWAHALEAEAPPFRIMGVGGVFRCDSDATHLPFFHQFEGVCVDQRVSMADLKGTVGSVVRGFFGSHIQTRFRPSFFPFTEPSAEVDCTCPLCQGRGCVLCKQTGWLEIGGCGLIHPQVIRSAGQDPERLEGFAFGFGLERMAMILYGIPDIRLLPENDLRFLQQFGV